LRSSACSPAIAFAGCVPRGKYDDIARDAQHLQAELRDSQAHLRTNDVELARLRASIADAETAARDRDKRLFTSSSRRA